MSTARAPVRLLPAEAPSNLPVSLTSFVGRERELAQVRDALASTRLLTLTGAGGCGKTRLALQAAEQLRDHFPDGVWWVELAPVRDPELVAAAIAQALGVRPLPGMTELQACGAYLAARRALVVLDNCEHLLDACAVAAEALLRAGREVVVLATSRASLGASGETDWRVPSLSLPQDGSLASDAVTLFAERARKVRPELEPAAELAAQVCTELDGLPLAIELAAARVRMLSLEQLATAVADRFRLLTNGPRTAVARQRTLRASVDWSHDLLSASERVLLRRLAVFAGGFTLEAVGQVCDPGNVFDELGSLVDQSLVVAGPGERYRLLETVRQYGLERLTEAGEQNALRDRHRDVFLALAERAGPELETGGQREWLERLDPDAANFAAALDHALATDPALALRFCAALHRWWGARGRFAEAELAHARSLHAAGDAEPALRAQVLQGRASLAIWMGDYPAAAAHASESLALAGDGLTTARARCHLGWAQLFADPRTARPELARAAELGRAVSDDRTVIMAKQFTASSHTFQFEHEPARRANDEVAALADRLGDPHLIAQRWTTAAWIAGHDGRLGEAHAALEHGRAAREGGEPNTVIMADVAAATLDIWQGGPGRALEQLEALRERSVKLGAGLALLWVLRAMALAELALGRPEDARARLEGLYAQVRGSHGFFASSVPGMLAIAYRLLGDPAAEATALEARVNGERIGNRLLATLARLTLGRLAAARGDFKLAREHVLAHLDASVEGGHLLYVPACLEALAEVAGHEDAVRLLAAAARARADMGTVRIPPEERHWAGIDARLRAALTDAAYRTARAEGSALRAADAAAWARRARGPRGRPPGGWGSLTPTEVTVAGLVAEGLSNREIAGRMFVSPETVKTHLAHIFRKLDVRNRGELTALVWRRDHPSG